MMVRTVMSGVGLLLLLQPATSTAQEAQIPGKGIYDLVRHLLKGHTKDASKIIRLNDDGASEQRASLYFTAGPSREIYAVFDLDRSRKLFVHTVRIREPQGRSAIAAVVKMEPVPEAGSGELVVARVPRDAVDWMLHAARLTFELQGWDRSFRGSVEDKTVERIQSFLAIHSSPSPGTEQNRR